MAAAAAAVSAAGWLAGQHEDGDRFVGRWWYVSPVFRHTAGVPCELRVVHHDQVACAPSTRTSYHHSPVDNLIILKV